MSNITVWFIKSAMVYFVLAMFVGISMTVAGPLYPYKPIHTHLNLLGWMSMMIYGVSYHILPRFSGEPLWSDRLATIHLWTANIGLIGMIAGWMAAEFGGGITVLHIFSLIEGLSVMFFVTNMFMTVKAAPAMKKPMSK
ncbi:MAG: hypothetical protein HY890_08475 [Deltaproteobacteria bacterium]|nr:hypothetical protein [Deltaproteobacteria bacterium]